MSAVTPATLSSGRRYGPRRQLSWPASFLALVFLCALLGASSAPHSVPSGCTTARRTVPHPKMGITRWHLVPNGKGEFESPVEIGQLLFVQIAYPPDNDSAPPVEFAPDLVAIEASTGAVRWTHSGRLEAVDAASNRIYYSDVEGRGLTAADADTGRTVWSYRVDDYFPGPKAYSAELAALLDPTGSRVIVHRENFPFVAVLDSRTGKMLWKVNRFADVVRAIQQSDGEVFLDFYTMDANLDTHMYLAALSSATGKWLWRRPVAEPRLVSQTAPWTTLASYRGRLFVILDDGLHAIDGESGADVWRVRLEPFAAPFPEPALDFNGDAVAVSQYGKVSQIDLETGATRWLFDTHPGYRNSERSPTHRPGLARATARGLVVAGDDSVSCLDPKTGRLLWSTPNESELINNVVVNDSSVCTFGLRTQDDFAPASYVEVLDVATGAPVWRDENDAVGETALCTGGELFLAGPAGLSKISPR